MAKRKGTNNDLQNIIHKTKDDREIRTRLKTGGEHSQTLLTELENSHIRHVFMCMFVIYLYFHVLGVQPRFVCKVCVAHLLSYVLLIFCFVCFRSVSCLILYQFRVLNTNFHKKWKFLITRKVVKNLGTDIFVQNVLLTFVYPYALHITRSTYAVVLRKMHIYIQYLNNYI